MDSFSVQGYFFRHGPINVHAGAYMDEPSYLAKFFSFNTLFPNFNILTTGAKQIDENGEILKTFRSQFIVFFC